MSEQQSDVQSGSDNGNILEISVQIDMKVDGGGISYSISAPTLFNEEDRNKLCGAATIVLATAMERYMNEHANAERAAA